MHNLTLREEECVHLLAEGLTCKQIGVRLGLADSTVRSYLVSAYRRLGVSTGPQAVLKVLGEARTAFEEARIAELKRERERLKGEVGAVKLTARAFDALLAGDRYGALGLRVAADELRVQHGLPRRPQFSSDEALERILDRCGIKRERSGVKPAPSKLRRPKRPTGRKGQKG